NHRAPGVPHARDQRADLRFGDSAKGTGTDSRTYSRAGMNNYKRWVIYTAALFLTISAALVSGSHLYYMAGILLMLPLVSYLLGMISLRDVDIVRETPGSGWDGETATFHF